MIPHEWRSPSPNEFGKRVIHGRPHTYNNNGSWKPDATPDSSLTPEDAAAATAIATVIASTVSDAPSQRKTAMLNTLSDEPLRRKTYELLFS